MSVFLSVEAPQKIVHLDRVRCLECGSTYVKPTDGGTVQQNPGCPSCGYVGWMLATIPPLGAGLRRFAEDRRRRRTVQSH